MKLIKTLAVILCMGLVLGSPSALISSTPNTIGEMTVYRFIMTNLTSGSITSGSYINIQFPVDFNFTNVANLLLSVNAGFASTPQPSLSLSKLENKVKISGSINSNTLIDFSIFGIYNPNYNNTDQIILGIRDNTDKPLFNFNLSLIL
jgi:hypothetical protein